MLNEKDAVQVTGINERIEKNYLDKTFQSHSFDKGFGSLNNYETL